MGRSLGMWMTLFCLNLKFTPRLKCTKEGEHSGCGPPTHTCLFPTLGWDHLLVHICVHHRCPVTT